MTEIVGLDIMQSNRITGNTFVPIPRNNGHVHGYHIDVMPFTPEKGVFCE